MKVFGQLINSNFCTSFRIRDATTFKEGNQGIFEAGRSEHIPRYFLPLKRGSEYLRLLSKMDLGGNGGKGCDLLTLEIQKRGNNAPIKLVEKLEGRFKNINSTSER